MKLWAGRLSSPIRSYPKIVFQHDLPDSSDPAPLVGFFAGRLEIEMPLRMASVSAHMSSRVVISAISGDYRCRHDRVGSGQPLP